MQSRTKHTKTPCLYRLSHHFLISASVSSTFRCPSRANPTNMKLTGTVICIERTGSKARYFDTVPAPKQALPSLKEHIRPHKQNLLKFKTDGNVSLNGMPAPMKFSLSALRPAAFCAFIMKSVARKSSSNVTSPAAKRLLLLKTARLSGSVAAAEHQQMPRTPRTRATAARLRRRPIAGTASMGSVALAARTSQRGAVARTPPRRAFLQPFLFVVSAVHDTAPRVDA